MDTESAVKRFSLSIDEELARAIENLARTDNRTFNGEFIELVKKGMELHLAEKSLIKTFDPLHIVKSNKVDDDPLKHLRAPGLDDEQAEDDRTSKLSRELA